VLIQVNNEFGEEEGEDDDNMIFLCSTSTLFSLLYVSFSEKEILRLKGKGKSGFHD
jgi:hypothetical protein